MFPMLLSSIRRPRFRLAALAALLVVALLSTGAGDAAEETPQQAHSRIRERIRRHLEEKLWPWWLENSVDEKYGGFVVELKRDGSVRSGRKTLVSQARQIWAFSRMWNAGYREPRVERAARRGVRFLKDHFWDGRHGGWFLEVGRNGRPARTSKSTYAHAFVIYAGVEYHRAFGDETGLQAAEVTFQMLEQHAKDPRAAGYFGRTSRDWNPGRGPHEKSMNTQLHLLEALAELYAETGRLIHRERLEEILDALVEHAYLPEYGCCVEHFNQDWSLPTRGRAARRNRSTSYGHNVEFAWLMQRAAEVLDLPPERYREIGLRLIDHALRYGWHQGAGALCNNGPLRGSPKKCKMVWWVQSENLVALDWAWRRTGQKRYLKALDRQTEWLMQSQADPVYGGWWDTVAPAGRVLERRKAHVWHLAYHEVRGCLNVVTGSWQ